MPSDTPGTGQALHHAVLRVMRSFARLLVRHGMSMPAFVELAKRAYVDVAMRHFGIPGKKPTVSRASLLTGLTRKEVQRLVDEAESTDLPADTAPDNRAARVVAGWIRDPDFLDATGQPRPLAFDGEVAGQSFSTLVRRYSGDVPPRAVLDELLQVGNVERGPDGGIRLLTRVYLPRGSDTGKLAILGSDVAYLIRTIDHNLQGHEPARFQRKVTYDNLPVEAVDEFRAMSARHSQELIELLGEWLARHDRDVNPEVQGTGRKRAGVGIFYFEENVDDAPGDRK
jgi:hypothetical protein